MTFCKSHDGPKAGKITSKNAPLPPIKNKSVTPVVGGWVRGQKRTRVRFIFSDIFYRVFELPLPRNARKRDKKNREKVGFGLLVEFFVKAFRHDFCCKTFFVVFLNSHRWKTPENAIKQKKVEEKLTSNFLSKFWEKFSTRTFAKTFLWCFWTPLAEKCPKTYQ
jgi:hypothetical protein